LNKEKEKVKVKVKFLGFRLIGHPGVFGRDNILPV
jgi:hypothetical protein